MFQHLVLDVPETTDNSQLEAILDDLSRDGWELVCGTTAGVVFRRQKREDSAIYARAMTRRRMSRSAARSDVTPHIVKKHDINEAAGEGGNPSSNPADHEQSGDNS